MNYSQICSQVCDVARVAGRFIRSERQTFTDDKIEYKGAHNLVSYVDKQAERLIVDRLLRIIPDSQIIAEEGTIAGNHKGDVTLVQTNQNNPRISDPESHTWIIDPLDGTANFIHNMPPYCVSIGLMRGNEIVVGVIYVITSDEMFCACQNAPAYLNGQQIQVSTVDDIQNSLVITGIAYAMDDSQNAAFLRQFEYFYKNTHGIRRLGSAAADLAYIAAGRADAFYHVNLAPWDVAAGALIVKQAGGIVSDFNGQDNYLFGKSIIATNNHIYNNVKKIISQD